jgi:murein DD-endopeptidase MepM/ murein hydrolase activator NlpD
MAKIKYYYDTETCRYERVKTSTFEVGISVLGGLLLCAIFGGIFSLLHAKYFPSKREVELIKENSDLLYAYELLENDVNGLRKMLSSLQDRDDNIYRVIFEADPLPKEVRRAGTGGTQQLQELAERKLQREDIILSVAQKVESLKKQMYVQTKSYDEIAALAKRKTEMLTSIPAIQPLSNKDLKRFASGFGMRIDPILKVRKMHTGCDFSAPKGTPVYATGDGVVVTVESDAQGYGKQIEINHGFGYVTKYAHLSAFDVRLGQKVKRGQQIGKVGSTGKSVAPHLHYEIIYGGKKVDPVNYFHNDVTPEQYNELLRLGELENQSLGF